MGLTVNFKTIAEMFDNVAAKFSDGARPMLMYKSEGAYRGLSYREVNAMVEEVTLGLSELGIVRGDTVALISENRPEWVIADMSIIHLGAVNVPVYPTMTPKQIEFILNDARVKCVIVSNRMQLAKVLKIADEVKLLRTIISFNEKGVEGNEQVVLFSSVITAGKALKNNRQSVLREYSDNVKPEDLLTIIYTSGTTGNPKGVMLTHNNLVSNIQASAACLSIMETDVLLSFLPLSHAFERMAGYYTALGCGATIAYAESVDTVGDNLIEIQPTIVTSVPRLFERIHNRIQKQVGSQSRLKQKVFGWAITTGKRYAKAKKEKLFTPMLALKRMVADRLVFRELKKRTGGKIRFFVSGGAALARELGEFFEAIGLPIIEGYGMSESSPVISVNRLGNSKFGSVGPIIPGIDVKIAGDGEILVCGPNVMKGYWNNPESTSEAIDSQGWLHTGDIGMFDEEGFLYITDRKKHLFVSSGGKNIAPQHIESLFLQSKYIDQIMLVGDGRMYITALIIPDMDLLQEMAKELHLSYSSIEEVVKRPEIYKFLDEEIASIQKDLPNYERVRKFTILDKPFTIEEGEMTPTMKIKRKAVELKYKEIIERMYRDIS